MSADFQHSRMKLFAVLAVVTAVLFALLLWATESPDPLPADTRADLIVIEKARRSLTLFLNGKDLRTYRVALGRRPIGNKERAGDDRTPEGHYVIDRRNAQSAFHLSLHVSYPSSEDRLRASRAVKK